jgi:hypothetical protein
MKHTYSTDYCAECDAAYRSYGCVANDNSTKATTTQQPDQNDDESFKEIVADLAEYRVSIEFNHRSNYTV